MFYWFLQLSRFQSDISRHGTLLIYTCAYEKSRACFLSVWSTEMGALLFSGGLSIEAEVGRGGAVVMLSFTPKSQVTGEPGLEMMEADTCWITSRCRVGFSGGFEVISIGPICLIKCRLSRLSGLNLTASSSPTSPLDSSTPFSCPVASTPFSTA